MKIESSDFQLTAVTWIAYMIVVRGETLDFRLQHIPESPGLCYEHIGEARLSSSVCKTLSYIYVAQTDGNFENIKKFAKFTVEFCQKHEHSDWINLAECRSST